MSELRVPNRRVRQRGKTFQERKWLYASDVEKLGDDAGAEAQKKGLSPA